MTAMNRKTRGKDWAKTAYAAVLRAAEAAFGQDGAKKLDVLLRFRKKLNLKNPQTLAEKVVYLSLHGLPELAVSCTDKWEVRTYVAQKGLEEILIPVCGEAVSRAEDVDFEALPDRFVLKATHGCSMNYVCTDKAGLNGLPGAHEALAEYHLRNLFRGAPLSAAAPPDLLRGIHRRRGRHRGL